MTKTTKIIAGVVIVAILAIGIGYAAINNIFLNIDGSAAANPDQANFTVKLTGTPTVSDKTKVTEATVKGDLEASITVQGLTAKGEKVTATYTIENTSADLSANLSAAVSSNTNTEYFIVTPTIATPQIKHGETTTVTVEVQLLKTPVTQNETSEIGVKITATPEQPK